MKINYPKIFLYTMLSLIVFAIGRTYGYIECRNKYKANYEFQHLQIDTLRQRTFKLKATYDSIKKSPCFNNKQ